MWLWWTAWRPIPDCGCGCACRRLEEQQEVEGYYIQQGYLLPKVHKSYWMGGCLGTSNPAAG